MSPGLAALCEESEEITSAVMRANLMTTQDLGSLTMDADLAADKLKLSPAARGHFASIFAITKARAETVDQSRMQIMLDVLNGEGKLIMRRPRCDVHRQGFWHRAVNLWILCPLTSRVLIAQRSASKDVDPEKWTCVCGRVPSGGDSHNTAHGSLESELSIRDLPDDQVSLVFSMKCPRKITTGLFSGQDDTAWMDVYVALLKEEIPIERLHLDVRAKQAAEYMPLDDFQRALERKDAEYVIPSNPEYAPKLFRYMHKTCQAWQALRPV